MILLIYECLIMCSKVIDSLHIKMDKDRAGEISQPVQYLPYKHIHLSLSSSTQHQTCALVFSKLEKKRQEAASGLLVCQPSLLHELQSNEISYLKEKKRR